MVDISLKEYERHKVLIHLISLFCIGITLSDILVMSLTGLLYGVLMELVFLPGYLFVLIFNAQKNIRSYANILSINYLLNAASATLIFFPSDYGFHFYLLVVPSIVWILFPKKGIERTVYTLLSLIAFYLSEFTPGLSSLSGLSPYSRVFFGASIFLSTLGSMACVRYYAHFIQRDSNQLSHMASTDPLTGLENRRFFEHTGEADFQSLWREKKDLSVLMIDLDHFKIVNDNFGHAAGDRVLKSVGAALKGSFRNADKVCRYGGEEFLVLLKGTGMEDCLRIAEEIRRKIHNLEFPDYENLKITTSIGIAHMIPEDSSLKQIILRADKALYYAKDGGRNCVKDDQNNSIILCTI
ncbi:GGDEF domain-containing protein [Oceanispirochaeta sp.]|jgi:diguanylate cyclase (GGDEF)-like protein|uniref:GGDEF domain-containing protein n=1 Tax=Oceanispirochaeta sp. TaxID=2035350 RepID=UPI00260C7C92|nr:GGDEF domain-containing protein [Oceanispirochaeta sp.]MDA3958095.1 GGDEF domain-containing protein [Oceanispirochaeta sp.]